MICRLLLLVQLSSVNGPLQPPPLTKTVIVGSMTDVAGSRSRPRMYMPLTAGANVNQTPRKPMQLVEMGSLFVVARKVSMLVLTNGKVEVGTTMAPEQRSFGGTTGRVTRSCTLSDWFISRVTGQTQTTI